MERVYKQVEGHPSLARDTKSHAIINRNTDAYEQAKKRAAAARCLAFSNASVLRLIIA